MDPAVFYNAWVKTWDVIIVGGGIIGLSLSIALRKRGAKVLLLERGEPGREASHAAAGMLCDCAVETPAALQPLAAASARMYPEFVHELQDESGVDVDLRDEGTILFPPPQHIHEYPGFTTDSLLPCPLAELEPTLADSSRPAIYLKERSVDPRALVAATFKAAKHREVDISSGTAATEVILVNGRAVDHDSLRAFNRVMRPQGSNDRPGRPTAEQQKRINSLIARARSIRPPRPKSGKGFPLEASTA